MDNPADKCRMVVISLVVATIEETRAWLSRYLENEELLDRLLERTAALRSHLEAPGSATISGMPNGGGYAGDKIGHTLGKIEVLEAEAQDLLAISRNLYREISQGISRLRGTAKGWPHRKVVLEMRYLDRLEWSEINKVLWSGKADFDDRLESYQRRTFRIHAEALEAMANIVTGVPLQDNDTESEDRK